MSAELKATYAQYLGDNSLILGQRLSEWCGHSPALELDMSLSNLSLDLIGQAQLFLGYSAQLLGQDLDEDKLAFLRDVMDFKNVLLVEQPNGDFAHTVARQFFFSAFQSLELEALKSSTDAELAAIAAKASKEVAYHLRFARDWTIRLGDGTEESAQRMQVAIEDMWRFTDELFHMDETHQTLLAEGVAPDLTAIRPQWDALVDEVLAEAKLTRPAPCRPIMGGREGHHSEHLGHILSEMQYLQRAYPGAQW